MFVQRWHNSHQKKSKRPLNFRYEIVAVLEKIVAVLGDGAKQLWLGTVVVG